MRRSRIIALGLLAVVVAGCSGTASTSPLDGRAAERAERLPSARPRDYQLVAAARAQVGVTVDYDASYVQLDYPGGDVPIGTGVCTDVVVRALRYLGVDLQQVVHEDMLGHFGEYPQRWGLAEPDANIDHRRVPNLQTYFTRRGLAVQVSDVGNDYLPGDIVTWLVQGRPHIGIVSDRPARDGTRYQIIHNIGRGTLEQDFLFRYDITGHFRWDW